MNINKETALHRVGKLLSDVASGRRGADLVIQNVQLINVNTGEIQQGIDIAVAMERIALVGDAAHTITETTTVIDGSGLFAAPGFIDGHMHVESSMMSPKEYAKLALPHGTTSIFPDPHEIASVCGMAGVDFLIKDSEDIPMRMFYNMPSCLPAMPGFEDYGYTISADETAELLAREDLYALGEMMDFLGVIAGNDEVHKKIAATLAQQKTVTGHYASTRLGKELNAYAASGVRCCHESVAADEALAKMRLGMYAQIREGGCSKDLSACIKAVTESKLDTRFVTLVSDDCHPANLVSKGNMDYIIRRAIEEGVPPVTAIQMGTINSAACFSYDKDLGSIAPGKLADIVLLSDLEQVTVAKVFVGGRLIAEDGKLVVEIGSSRVPEALQNSAKLSPALSADRFSVAAPGGSADSVQTNVIEIIPSNIYTKRLVTNLKVTDGTVPADIHQNVAKISVIDHHRPGGTMSTGFVSGFGLREGAVVSTVGHDAHNMLIIGVNDADMAFAGNTIAKAGGGMAVVKNGEVLALLPLPIGGLMTAECGEYVVEKCNELDEALASIGCTVKEPFYQLSFLSLGVIPSLRLTNRGLMDSDNGCFVPLFL